MELKETKSMHATSEEIAKLNSSRKNNSDGLGIYNILYRAEDTMADHHSDNKDADKEEEKPKFGSVSTLDWLKTWRSIKIG